MPPQDNALASITTSGLRAVLEWAAPIAFARTGNDYDEDAGHDQAVIGLLNYEYLRDLIDRATSNGRYALPPGGSGAGMDFVRRGITPTAFSAMPVIEAGAIARNDYQNSPGWTADGHRVLLQSFKFGGVDRINWGQRSNAKTMVAQQLFVGGVTLFDDEDYGLESIPGIPEDDEFVGLTLIVAHSYDPSTGQFELHVGQSKLSEYRGDSCWHWRVPLLVGDADPSTALPEDSPTLPGDPVSGSADDVEVRIRDKRIDGTAGTGND